MFDFDKVVNRVGTGSTKWDSIKDTYKREDLIPLWVADMDFEVAPEIVKVLEERVNHKVFGYVYPSEDYFTSVIDWMDRRHGFKVEKDWIAFTPGVVSGISYAIRAFTEEDDNIIIQTPVYHPFYYTIRENKRNIVKNPLIFKDGNYTMDFEDLEKKIDEKTKMIIICNPHNPVGRVWTEEELKKLTDICLKHDIIIVSDEIHSDLVYSGHKHTMLGSISDEVMNKCVMCTAPSKSFNLAGLQVSNMIIPNDELREKFIAEREKDHLIRPNIFAERGLVAAYGKSENWLDELMVYIEGNKDYFIDYLENHIPQLKVVKPEGTYLLWMDCSGLNMSADELERFFIDKCGLVLNRGDMFGEEGANFQRVNIGCTRATLEKSLIRMKNAVEKLNI